MKHLVPCLMTLLFLPSAASAACIDDLRKLAELGLMFNEAKVVPFNPRAPRHGSFIVYFDKGDTGPANNTTRKPTDKDSGAAVIAFRSNRQGETVEDHDRISFLNRDNFVIRTTHISYEGSPDLGRGGEILKAESVDYFFCTKALQIPTDIEGTQKEAKYKYESDLLQERFFNTLELARYMDRIKK